MHCNLSYLFINFNSNWNEDIKNFVLLEKKILIALQLKKIRYADILH